MARFLQYLDANLLCVSKNGTTVKTSKDMLSIKVHATFISYPHIILFYTFYKLFLVFKVPIGPWMTENRNIKSSTTVDLYTIKSRFFFTH